MNDNENGNYYNSDNYEEGQNVSGSNDTAGSESKTSYSNYSYYNMDNAGKNSSSYGGDEKKKGNKNKRSFGAVVATTAVIAVIAGAVAGGTFYGVNYAANRFFYDVSGNGSSDASDNDSSSFEENISEAMQDGQNESGESSQASDTSQGTMTVKEVAAECMPSVVTIAAVSQQELSSIFGGTQIYESSSVGTGVIIGMNDTELLIATNQHLTGGASSLSVGFIDETAIDAQIKGEDDENDLAVVSVKLTDIPAETMDQIKVAAIGNSDELELGDQVVAIGNALGYGQSVTSGYISAKDRDIYLTDGNNTYNATDLLQTDAAINSGNSGGPLLNMKGEVIGINEAKRMLTQSGETVEGMGYAIPISKAEPILQELMSFETREKVDEESRGYLGITLANVTEEVSEMYNMPVGVCVTEVIENGPAQEAGLQKGDVITEMEGRSIDDYDDLTEQLEYYAVGDVVEFVIMRADNGEYIEKTVQVTLGDSTVLDDYYNSQD